MNSNQLAKILKENFNGYKFVIVSYREPYIHSFDEKKKIQHKMSVGGVSISLDAFMRATSGLWVAHGSGNADREVVDKKNRLGVPVGDPKYTLKRVWISKEEMKGFYAGFSNECLWPLCHVAFVEPIFREEDWKDYKTINKRFAEAVLEEINKEKKVFIWIHDYQLSLVAKYIKEKRPDAIIAFFWHIPWPTFEIFRICPWRREILKSLLQNDLLGFQRYYHLNNFLQTVGHEFDAKINNEDLSVTYKGKETRVDFFPISIDYEDIAQKAKHPKAKNNFKDIIKKYIKSPFKYLAVGVDRVDYTKGIPQRLFAIERFLRKNPKFIGQFVYLGIGSPSRVEIESYRKLSQEIKQLVARINRKFKKRDWQPVYYINQVLDSDTIIQLYNKADLCIVNCLDDGMNLVAKEYVAANNGKGALILSQFIGAAKELDDAFLVNPFDVKNTSRAIKDALTTPLKERQRRMKKMKSYLQEHNIFLWTASIIQASAKTKV